MSRSREERSHVRKHRRGCLSGCLTNLLLLLGLISLLFVGACVLGIVKNDAQTGKPYISFENIGLSDLPEITLPDFSALSLPDFAQGVSLPDFGQVISLPSWAYHVERSGLTIKALRGGSGEAVLVCSDGYTMLCGGGSGSGVTLGAQLLLCGVNQLSIAAALSASDEQIGGMPMMLSMMKPDYLLFQDTQVKGAAYNRMLSTVQSSTQTQALVPAHGLCFTLGRATVTVIGPTRTLHTNDADDGLSLRIDYGDTSVLIMGGITAQGEQDIVSSGVRMDADALICAQGGGQNATSSTLVNAVHPKIALMTGNDPSDSVRTRLEHAGASVYTKADNGVMTLFSDGTTLRIVP